MNLGTHVRNAKSELAKVIFPTKGQVKQAYVSVIIVVTVIVGSRGVEKIVSKIFSKKDKKK